MKNEDKQRRKPYIAQFYRGNRFAFLISVLYTIVISSVNLALAWLIQQITDTVSGVPGSLGFGALAMLTAVVIAAIALLKAVNYHANPRFMQKAMRQFKDYAFEKLTRKSIASFESESASLYLSAFSNDASTIESDYLEKQFDLIFQMVMLIGSIVMMLAYNPLLTVVAVGFFILPVIASLVAGDRVEKAQRRVSDRNAELVASLKDSLSGFSVVKSFKAENAMQTQFANHNGAVEAAKCQRRRISTVISAIGSVAGVTAQLGTFLVGGVMAVSGFSGWSITPGVLLLFIDLTANVINPIGSLPELLAARKAARGLIDKIAAALESNVSDEGAELPAKLREDIRIQNLTFGYEEGKPVLNDISCHFEAGKSYAVVGASGSGKSTLLKLLMAAHGSYQGSVTFDGMELRECSSQSLYEMVSMVQQQVFVFNASIRDNITMFRDFPIEAVEEAIRQAGLTEWIAERGENDLCGENGSGLSGGEKQRISIARSLLRGSSVLLVDEATSALDAQTAWQVSNAILDLDGMTRIVVTHALEKELLRRYDGILVLKNGRIAECGAFDDLMAQKGYFYSLYTVAQ